MPDAVFVAQLDDLQGFLVKQRYPNTLVVTEKVLNLMFMEHQTDSKLGLKLSEIDGVSVASYSDTGYPGWFVCFILKTEEKFTESNELMIGMSRLVLELIKEAPNGLNLEDIVMNQSVLAESSEEQKCASIFVTPSTALLLEKMQSEGVIRAASLALWLRNQVQSEDIDLREAISPLMEAGIIKVEMVGKTSEMVFLIRDLFGYRAPPVESLLALEMISPNLAVKYREHVTNFFSPAPPSRGYNPTLAVDDPNSPIMDDRRTIASILSKSLNYEVIKSLRGEVRTATEIAAAIAFPVDIVLTILFALQSEGLVMQLEDDKIWALVTNPIIELFMPEYILPMISKKLVDKEIPPEIASRHLALLMQTWSET